MGKRLWKNAILALCVLALVLQPVNIYGAVSSVYYNNVNLAGSAYNNFSGSNSTFINLLQADYNTPIGYLFYATYYEYGNDYIYFCRSTNSGQSYFLQLFSRNDVLINTNSAHNVNVHTINSATRYYVTVSSDEIYDDPYSFTSETVAANTDILVGTNSFPVSIGVVNTNGYYFYGTKLNGYSNYYKWTVDTTGEYNSSVPSGNVPGLDEPSETSATFGEYLLFQFIKSNFFYNQSNAFLNASWVPAGYYLTYEYQCKIHPDQENITLISWDGQSITVPNYIYSSAPTDYSASLSTIQNTLNTISSRANTTNTRLNTLNTSINTQMNAVNNKLEAAFPADQAAINDFIAEDLMDDTDGNGLTINRIASSKSDLDDGLSTFKLDTSGSQYSNPFSALGDADWSFWSQTTLNNLGSGYSYSFGEGSLMSENDVFTENQNNLLNLLGW